MSVLTVEERMMLCSLKCKNQAEALTVLTHFAANLQVEELLHSCILALITKLEQEHLDYMAETENIPNAFGE